MAKVKSSSDNSNSSAKSLSPYQHLKNLVVKKDPDYYIKLSDDDKKTFIPWVLNSMLTGKMDYILIVNEVNKYLDSLTPDQVCKIYCNVLPTVRMMPQLHWKPKSENTDIGIIKANYPVILKLFQKEYETISTAEAIEYFMILNRISYLNVIDIIKFLGKKWGETPELQKEVRKYELKHFTIQ